VKRASSKKQAIRDYLAARKPAAITEVEWNELLCSLSPISETYLRDVLRESGLPFIQPWAGVRQKSFEDLEQSLRDLLEVYSASNAAGDRERARYCRRQVIAAKDRARFVAQSPKTSPEKQAQKREMVEWMLVWLENPEVFPAWVEARKGAGRNQGTAS
jgi:hypothetical protein